MPNIKPIAVDTLTPSRAPDTGEENGKLMPVKCRMAIVDT